MSSSCLDAETAQQSAGDGTGDYYQLPRQRPDDNKVTSATSKSAGHRPALVGACCCRSTPRRCTAGWLTTCSALGISGCPAVTVGRAWLVRYRRHAPSLRRLRSNPIKCLPIANGEPLCAGTSTPSQGASEASLTVATKKSPTTARPSASTTLARGGTSPFKKTLQHRALASRQNGHDRACDTFGS
jgi:hypothetical protein